MNGFDVGAVVVVMTLLAALAFLIESVIEAVVASWLSKLMQDDELRAMVLKLLGSVLGVVLALIFGIDLLGAVSEAFGVVAEYPEVAAVVGQVLTGLLMGRGAQWFHDVGVTWLGLDGTAPTNRVM